jgi:hypothetical protein
MPFSNGLDSRAVAGLMAREMGNRLVRVRLGLKLPDGKALAHERQAFTTVPYKVRAGNDAFVESTARSRGFKFALISGIASYLAHAGQVIVPESGQGALGPTLVTVGQAYEDYRSHPLFTGRMEKFVEALLGHRVRYVFPQLWNTKGETLRRFVEECGDETWSSTWSCWRQTRHVSVDAKKRQCGICAACMLRRMSVHAAGLSEPAGRYVWAVLSHEWKNHRRVARVRHRRRAAPRSPGRIARFQRAPSCARSCRVSARRRARAAEAEARVRLDRLLQQHSTEWEAFMLSLGPDSFVADWALRGRV